MTPPTVNDGDEVAMDQEENKQRYFSFIFVILGCAVVFFIGPILVETFKLALNEWKELLK